MDFSNVYQDPHRAAAYAKLEFPGTYYLAYRDLPAILLKHTHGRKALDFGCGTGRSTRFVQNLGFQVIGLDISTDMINLAKEIDPSGDYRLIENGNFESVEKGAYDLITSIFTFDNIPGKDNRLFILQGLADLINRDGKIIMLDSTPEIYHNEWASFTTKDFPENKLARGGEKVRIIMTDVEDQRPVEDIIWLEEDYLDLFSKAGLHLEATYKPLGKMEEPYNWKSELSIAPWVIYVLTGRETT